MVRHALRVIVFALHGALFWLQMERSSQCLTGLAGRSLAGGQNIDLEGVNLRRP